jgi:hypothetical protein
MLTQKQRKAADASAAAIDPAEAARLEREAIRAELAKRPGENWDKDPEPSAGALEQVAARKAAGPRALVAVPRGTGTAATTKPERLSWSKINGRDYARLEVADFAAEVKRLEREARRNAIPDAFTVQAVRRSAVVMLEDLSAAELAKAASAKRVTGAKSDYDQLAKVAADLGVEVAELDAMIAAEKLLVADGSRPVQDSKAEVGYPSAATPAEVLERAEAAREALRSEAARAGREALDAIGPRASAVIVSNVGSDQFTVAQVRTVPDVGAARIRIEALTKPLAEARERLTAAIAKEDAARAAKAARPLKSAEADTARIAAGVAKIQKRMDAAKAAEALALELAALPSAEGLVTVPLESFELAEAAEAGALEIPERTDRMPSAFVERGPRVRTSSSWSGDTSTGGRGTGVADPTGNSAAALADGYARELAKVERLAAELAYRTSREALEVVAEAAKENQRSARKAADAERKRAARRAGKVKPRKKR